MFCPKQFLDALLEFGSSGQVGGASSDANPYGLGGVNQLAAPPNKATRDIEKQYQDELDDNLHQQRWAFDKDNLKMPGILNPRYDQLDLSLLDDEDEIIDKIEGDDFNRTTERDDDLDYGIYDERIASDAMYHSSPGNLPYNALENPKRHVEDQWPVQHFDDDSKDDVINLFHMDGTNEEIPKESINNMLPYGHGGVRRPKETIDNNTLAAPRDFTKGHQSFPKQDSLPAGGMGYVATARKFVPDNYPIESAMNIDEVIDEVLDDEEYDEEYGEEDFPPKEIDQRFMNDVETLEQQLEEANSIDEYRDVVNSVSDTIQSYKTDTDYHVPLEILIGLFRLRKEAEDKMKEQQ